VSLDQAARRERLRLIREDRLRRGGVPAYSEEYAKRDALASQQISDSGWFLVEKK